jgi:hypothetical protein
MPPCVASASPWKGIQNVLKVFVELMPGAFPPGATLNPQATAELEAQLMAFLRDPGKRCCFLPCGLHVGIVDIDPEQVPAIIQATATPLFNGNPRMVE